MNLPPIPFTPLVFIPKPDAQELPADRGWQLWDEAVKQLDKGPA